MADVLTRELTALGRRCQTARQRYDQLIARRDDAIITAVAAGMEHHEIAERLGVTRGRVSQVMMRARKSPATMPASGAATTHPSHERYRKV